MKPEELCILDRLEEKLAEDPDKVILSEGTTETDITRRELDILSGKVYRYLKKKGFGKEDVINILLPRGCNAVAALIGVWKAGACALMLEEQYPKEIISFIQKDSGCSFVIDGQVWDEIMDLEPLKGHETFNLNAAAYIVYTSGTGGNPKGVIHEYGSIGLLYASCHWEGQPMFLEEDILGLILPLNFVAAIMGIIYNFMEGSKILIIPHEVVQSPQSVMGFFLQQKVSVTVLPASLVRMVDDFGPYMKRMLVSAEPANGIWRPRDKMMIFNAYSSSESSTAVCVSLLDHPNEIAPVGRPQYGIKTFIMKEDGSLAQKGEEGEFCYETPYTRGYINLPELNEKAFHDRIFHSGDLAVEMEDGQYQIIGRISDMVKINGNRVEPAQVEEAVKKVTGIPWVGVRGFTDEHRTFLSAYHLGDTDIDIDELRERLKDHLPYYMLPSYFVKIEEIPKNKNGKLDRKSLPMPEAATYRSEYVPPSNETEMLLCDAMAAVLEVERIGVKDDFYLMGGDSLSSMMLLVEVGLEGLDLEYIYAGRTPEKIAKIYDDKTHLAHEDPEEIERESMSATHPLSAEQHFILAYQNMAPDTTMYNLYAFFKMGRGVSAEALADAMSCAIMNHPTLLTELFAGDDGTVMQRYVPEKMPKIIPEKISDEELETIKDTLVKPFDLMENLLWRCRVFDAPSGVYIFADVHHVMFDGYSLDLLFNDFKKVLTGEEMAKDYYYYVLSQREHAMSKETYELAEKYFAERYAKESRDKNLDNDFETSSNTAADMTLPIDISEEEFADFRRRNGLGKNGLFILAGLLALAAIKKSDNVMVTWIFNGRGNLPSMKSAGVLYYELPAALSITDQQTLGDVIADIREQLARGIEYSSYSYVRFAFPTPVKDDSVCILYQGDMYEVPEDDEFPIEYIELKSQYDAAQTSVDVEVCEEADGTILYLDYAASLYKEETIQGYGALMIEMATKLVRTDGVTELRTKDFIGSHQPD